MVFGYFLRGPRGKDVSYHVHVSEKTNTSKSPKITDNWKIKWFPPTTGVVESGSKWFFFYISQYELICTPQDLKFLSGLHLCLLGEIFNLSLAEHNVGVTGWVLVHVGLVDHEQNILRFTNSYSWHSGNLNISQNKIQSYRKAKIYLIWILD